MSKKHLSYSEWVDHVFCPFYHKLVHLDKIKVFKGNEFVSFGSALHKICEGMVIERELGISSTKWDGVFDKYFDAEIQKVKKDNIEVDENLISEMREQSRIIMPHIIPSLEETFPEFQLVDSELNFYEPIKYFETEMCLKGFIDLIIKTPDGKHHLIDFKSTSFGWKAEKKSDKITTYQLTFYKYFYAQKTGVELDKIETYFALLKRTAKKENVEIFRVTSGNKKIENALQCLKVSVRAIEKKLYLKNRTKCENCYFKDSELCRR